MSVRLFGTLPAYVVVAPTGEVLAAYDSTLPPGDHLLPTFPAGSKFRFLAEAERQPLADIRRAATEAGRPDAGAARIDGATDGSFNVAWKERADDGRLVNKQQLVNALVGGTFSAIPDARPRFTLSAPANEATVGVPLTLTFRALRDDGTVRAGFVSRVPVETPDGQRHRIQFVAGVATLAWSPRVSGSYRFASRREMRLDAPLIVEVYDS